MSPVLLAANTMFADALVTLEAGISRHGITPQTEIFRLQHQSEELTLKDVTTSLISHKYPFV